MPRISEWTMGTKPFFVVAAVLMVFGLLTFLLDLQSASFVQWDGIKVHGDTYGGVTTYTYDREQYSIDNRDVSADDLRHIPTTVWLSRSHPDDPQWAFIESPWDRWTDFVLLAGWFIGAFVVAAAGLVRSWVRRRRRLLRLDDAFGIGLDPELVQRILAERNLPPPRPTGANEWSA